VAVGQHVQLVAGVSLRLLLRLGDGGLVARRQLDVYLHVLPEERRRIDRLLGEL